MAIATNAEKLATMEWCSIFEPGVPLSPGDAPFSQGVKQNFLWGYPGIEWIGYVPPVEVPKEPGGGKSRWRRRPRRDKWRVVIGGERYWVRSIAEERAVIRDYLERQRLALEIAEAAERPMASKRVRLATTRLVNIEAEIAYQRKRRKKDEEELILLLMA